MKPRAKKVRAVKPVKAWAIQNKRTGSIRFIRIDFARTLMKHFVASDEKIVCVTITLDKQK